VEGKKKEGSRKKGNRKASVRQPLGRQNLGEKEFQGSRVKKKEEGGGQSLTVSPSLGPRKGNKGKGGSGEVEKRKKK